MAKNANFDAQCCDGLERRSPLLVASLQRALAVGVTPQAIIEASRRMGTSDALPTVVEASIRHLSTKKPLREGL